MDEVSKKEVTTIGNGYHYTNMYADHPKEYLPGNKKTSQTPPTKPPHLAIIDILFGSFPLIPPGGEKDPIRT